MQTYSIGDQRTIGTVVSGGLDELAKRLSERASGGILRNIAEPMQAIVNEEIRNAPVKTGRYKRSLHLSRTISSNGVGLLISVVHYAKLIRLKKYLHPRLPRMYGPLREKARSVGPSGAKPGTRWQAMLRQPAYALVDQQLAGSLVQTIVGNQNGG